jgi:hypothetical protein
MLLLDAILAAFISLDDGTAIRRHDEIWENVLLQPLLPSCLEDNEIALRLIRLIILQSACKVMSSAEFDKLLFIKLFQQ